MTALHPLPVEATLPVLSPRARQTIANLEHSVEHLYAVRLREDARASLRRGYRALMLTIASGDYL